MYPLVLNSGGLHLPSEFICETGLISIYLMAHNLFLKLNSSSYAKSTEVKLSEMKYAFLSKYRANS